MASGSKSRPLHVSCHAWQVASIFVPVVVLLSIITWVCWFTAGRMGCIPDEWVPEGADKEVCPKLLPALQRQCSFACHCSSATRARLRYAQPLGIMALPHGSEMSTAGSHSQDVNQRMLEQSLRGVRWPQLAFVDKYLPCSSLFSVYPAARASTSLRYCGAGDCVPLRPGAGDTHSCHGGHGGGGHAGHPHQRGGAS